MEPESDTESIQESDDDDLFQDAWMAEAGCAPNAPVDSVEQGSAIALTGSTYRLVRCSNDFGVYAMSLTKRPGVNKLLYNLCYHQSRCIAVTITLCSSI